MSANFDLYNEEQLLLTSLSSLCKLGHNLQIFSPKTTAAELDYISLRLNDGQLAYNSSEIFVQKCRCEIVGKFSTKIAAYHFRQTLVDLFSGGWRYASESCKNLKINGIGSIQLMLDTSEENAVQYYRVTLELLAHFNTNINKLALDENGEPQIDEQNNFIYKLTLFVV